MKRFTQVFIAILILSFSHLMAQSGKAHIGSISGTVADAVTGEVLPYAKVTLVGYQAGAITDEGGNFEFPYLPSGPYTLKVTYNGYQESRLVNVQVRNHKETCLHPTLFQDNQSQEAWVISDGTPQNGLIELETVTIYGDGPALYSITDGNNQDDASEDEYHAEEYEDTTPPKHRFYHVVNEFIISLISGLF